MTRLVMAIVCAAACAIGRPAALRADPGDFAGHWCGQEDSGDPLDITIGDGKLIVDGKQVYPRDPAGGDGAYGKDGTIVAVSLKVRANGADGITVTYARDFKSSGDKVSNDLNLQRCP